MNDDEMARMAAQAFTVASLLLFIIGVAIGAMFL